MSLRERVRSHLVQHGSGSSFPEVSQALREQGLVLGAQETLELVSALQAEFRGAGRLEELLQMPEVTDVLVNADGSVWVDQGRGVERSHVQYSHPDEVRRLAQRLAAQAGRRLDEASPFVDTRLADGTRVHALLPPISRDGPVLSLRVFQAQRMSLEQLVQAGACSPGFARWLEAVVHARLSFLISGGTGTGKTTLLAAMLSQADEQERQVIVEDSAELNPAHPNRVRLEARQANLEGVGAVTLTDLIRQCLRMRPDRIILGEVRGVEIVDLLAALNTGHEGGCGTLHANSAAAVPARVLALGLGAHVSEASLLAQLALGIQVVCHLARSHGQRRIEGLYVLKQESDQVRCVLALRQSATDSAPVPGPGVTHLRELFQDRGINTDSLPLLQPCA